MTEKIFHLVRHHEVAAYERLGWQRHPALDDTHHGEWSSLMEWRGAGEPVKPFRPAHETISPDEHNARQLADMRARAEWGDTVEERAG